MRKRAAAANKRQPEECPWREPHRHGAPPARSHSFDNEGRQQCDLLTAVKPRIVRQAHRIGAAERNGEHRSAGSADNDAEPGRLETELRHAGPSDFRLGQDAIRSRVSKQLERAVEARLEARCGRALRRAPAGLRAHKMPMAARGDYIDLPDVLDRNRHQPLRNERLKPWTTASAGKRQCREESR